MEIRGEGLRLRPLETDDAAAVASGLNDPDCARFMPSIPSPYTSADAEAWVEHCAYVWRTGESWPFAILDAETDEFLGSIELHHGTATVGYWVASAARGRGIATHALRLICRETSARPLRLKTHPDNLASQRVAQKAGFERIGTTSDHPVFRDGTCDAALFELA